MNLKHELHKEIIPAGIYGVIVITLLLAILNKL